MDQHSHLAATALSPPARPHPPIIPIPPSHFAPPHRHQTTSLRCVRPTWVRVRDRVQIIHTTTHQSLVTNHQSHLVPIAAPLTPRMLISGVSYGYFVIHDAFIYGPNSAGLVATSAQIALFAIYGMPPPGPAYAALKVEMKTDSHA